MKREPNKFIIEKRTEFWYSGWDLNSRPLDYQSRILASWTTEVDKESLHSSLSNHEWHHNLIFLCLELLFNHSLNSQLVRFGVTRIEENHFLSLRPLGIPRQQPSVMSANIKVFWHPAIPSTFLPKDGMASLYTSPRKSFPQYCRNGARYRIRTGPFCLEGRRASRWP